MLKTPPGYRFFLFTVISIITLSCNKNGNGKAEGEIILSGTLQSKVPVVIYIEELTPTEILPIDTIKTDNSGKFSRRLRIDHAGFYRLGTSQNNFFTLAAEPGETIEITASPENLRETYTVTGSEGSVILHRLEQNILKGQKLADSLRLAYRELKHQPNFETRRKELKQQYTEIVKEQRQFVLDVIDENPNSIASILALFQFFEDNLLLNENEHFEWFEKLSKTLCPLYPSNKHVISLKKKVHEVNRKKQQQSLNEQSLSPGSPAPEISLPDKNGNPLPLSTLKGQLVLIDFWASWCPPCRENNKVIATLLDDYRNSGFDVYSISLDRNRSQWLQAIENDKLLWKHVSDTRFMNSPVVNLFMVEELPHYVLVDREMNIIARNIKISELETLIRDNI